MSVRGRGLSGAASRLPLTPRNDQIASRPTLGEILEEVRREIGTLLNLFSDHLHAKILG